MKKLILILIFYAVTFGGFADAGTWERWMPCGWEKAWIGDSLAEVEMKCGPPSNAIQGPLAFVTENRGPVSITRMVQVTYYFYPGYRGKMYCLKFENLDLVFIGQEFWGKIPR